MKPVRVEKRDKLYEGKAKIVYTTSDPDLVIQHFKDSATAFDGKKKGTITDKGVVNASVSARLFRLLEAAGVRTHFRSLLDERDMLVEKLDMIPLEVVVRNIAAGSIAKRLGYEEGRQLKNPIVEFYYKNDALGDPLLTCQHVLELGVVDGETFQSLRTLGLKVNELLRKFFDRLGLDLVDGKYEFGFDRQGGLVLGDEISQDNVRLWDKTTGERLDKDRFRRDLGRVEEAYQEILRRVTEA